MRSDVTESLNRDLIKICAWCNLWGMRLNTNKTQSMVVSKSKAVFPPHPDLLVGSTSLNSCDSFKILGVMFDNKFTFERHIRSISSSVAQKFGLLRKSFRIFGDHDVLLKCFNSFILPCLEYCSSVWSSAADSHLKLLDRNLRACRFSIPNLTISFVVSLGHCVRFTRSFITLPILTILNFPTCSVPRESREVPWVLIVYLSHLWDFILLSIPDASFQLQPNYGMNFLAWL